MITPELISYLRARTAKNIPREAITNTLLASGWRPEDIAQGFNALETPTSPPAPTRRKIIPAQEKHSGRKVFLSLGLIATSGIYATWSLAMHEMAQQKKQPPIVLTPITVTPIEPVATAPVEQTPPAQPTPAKTTTTPAPVTTTPTPSPAPAPTSVYANGVFTGSPADAYYGTVQVKIAMQNDTITDVAFLQYPNSHGTSVEINSQAMPLLKQEALSAQSANVQIISGATDTSLAFRESLASALAKAKN